jgi:hypothetical protein
LNGPGGNNVQGEEVSPKVDLERRVKWGRKDVEFNAAVNNRCGLLGTITLAARESVRAALD